MIKDLNKNMSIKWREREGIQTTRQNFQILYISLQKFCLVVCIPSLSLHFMLIFLFKSLIIFKNHFKVTVCQLYHLFKSIYIDYFFLSVHHVFFFMYLVIFEQMLSIISFMLLIRFSCLHLKCFEYCFYTWLGNLKIIFILLRLVLKALLLLFSC